MSPVLLILSSVALGVVGQVSLKAGVSRIGPLALGRQSLHVLVWRLCGQPRILLGLSVYGVSTLFWLAVLSQVQLSYAYPFLSLSYVLIVLVSWLLFREQISLTRLIGVAAICFGVYAVAGGIIS